jgi:enterochelin esterase-like enzyme
MTEQFNANSTDQDVVAESPQIEPKAGTLVSEMLLDYDGGRRVTVYVPSTRPDTVIFTGDGQNFAEWGRLLERADVPTTMIVGVHGLAGEMPRLHEYSPVFDEARFSAHEQFFVEDVPRWVRSRFEVTLGVDRTAVFGYSAGAELALALGLRHPETYGTVIAGSPGGGYRPPVELAMPLPRVYLFAGTLEPFFLDNAMKWADALRAADAEVTMRERAASHGDDVWQKEFPSMVQWAFGRLDTPDLP